MTTVILEFVRHKYRRCYGVCMHMLTSICTHKHTHTHVYVCVHTRTHAHTYVRSIHTHMHKRVHAYTCTTHIIQLPGNDNGLLVEIPSTSHDMLPSYQMLHTAWPYTNNITPSKAPPIPYLSWSSSTNNKCSAK